jgi:hypothetical protein
MRKTFKIVAVLAVLVVVAAAVQPANAACGVARNFFADNYIYSPGVCVSDGTYPCGAGTSVTPAFKGTFWHVGNGNPAIGLGNDSGIYDQSFWTPAISPGYPLAGFNGGWNPPTIQKPDGCPDVPQPGSPAAKCMAILLEDVDSEGAPVFALLTAPANAQANYDFNQGDGTPPINLAPLPKVAIVNSVRQGGGTGVALSVLLDGAGLQDGLYINSSGDCAAVGGGGTSLIAGYRTRFKTQVSDTPPEDENTAGWPDCGSGVTPLGQPGNCSVPCAGDTNVFVSYSLVFDSGFELGIVGAPSTRAECGPNLAEPGERIRVRQSPSTSIRQK